MKVSSGPPRPSLSLRRSSSTAKSQIKSRTSPQRLVIIWLVLLLSAVGLACNLFRIQVLHATALQQRARNQQVASIRPFTPRRPMVDRLGTVVAVDRMVYSLYAHPIQFKQPKTEIVEALTPILQREPEELSKTLDLHDTGIELEYIISEETAERIRDLMMDGLELVLRPQRYYPQEDLFAGVVGFVDAEQQGQAGIEQTYQEFLARDEKEATTYQTGEGALLPTDLPRGFFQQDELHLSLTLDGRLQRAAQAKLREQVIKYKAKRGTAIAMDAQDGSILALVSEPSYNPNQYYITDAELLRNWSVTDLYEPGSTFKPLNVAIALEAGAIQPDDVFYDEGAIQIGEWSIQNNDYEAVGARGSQSVTDILKYSSNVGMVHIMEQVDPVRYYEWLQQLGIGQRIGIDLPSEATGQMKDFHQFTLSRVESATAAFGQGFSLTPVQLLQLHGILANGGKLVTPHVVKGLFDAQGKLVWQPDLPPAQPIFSPETTQTVVSMMESVVHEGTGRPALVSGYRVAGKTGTAQKADPHGGYLENASITSFVSIFPADAPRYVFLIVVDEPQGDDAYGSTVAAPVGRWMMESLVTTIGIPPSYPEELLQEPSPSESSDPLTVDPLDDSTEGLLENLSNSDTNEAEVIPSEIQEGDVDQQEEAIEEGSWSNEQTDLADEQMDLE